MSIFAPVFNNAAAVIDAISVRWSKPSIWPPCLLNNRYHATHENSYSIAQAIAGVDEFFSVVSSAFSEYEDVFYDPSPPSEPFVGS
jgi:hypothetical protein